MTYSTSCVVSKEMVPVSNFRCNAICPLVRYTLSSPRFRLMRLKQTILPQSLEKLLLFYEEPV